MFKKSSEDSLVPFCDCMDHAYSKRSNRLTDSYFPCSFEHEELLVLVTRIFDSMRIVHVAFPLADEEEIESTIDREYEYKTRCKYSEYRDGYEGEKLPQNSRKCHHRDEYHNRSRDSGDDGNRVFMHCEHDRTLWIISDSDLRTCSLHDHNDGIDGNSE